MPNPAVFIETYGCQMNVLDAELVRDQLAALGYRFIDVCDEADVVLINTCSVRELSEHKVWSQLGRLGVQKRVQQKRTVVGVLGCMAEREGRDILKRMPHVDVICGPSNLDHLPVLLDNALRNRGAQVSLAGHTSRRGSTLEQDADAASGIDLARAFAPESQSAQAYVRVTRGCNKFCSFCVVPFTRGPEVHRSPDDIVAEVKRLVDVGVVEVTLIGQTVNHYLHRDGGRTTSFADLLGRVHDAVPDLPRLRFLTSYPRDFGDDALDVMAQSPRICRYLHLPVQSGSDRMLAAMNRGHTVSQYLDLLARARARMPDIRIASDMIVGFPTETEDDHEASVTLLHTARFKSCFVFKYSPRPGTVAARRYDDDVPEATKRTRNQSLLDVQAEISLQLHAEHMGQILEVFVEGHSKLRNRASGQRDAAPQALLQLASPADAARDGLCRLVGRTRGDEIVAFDGPGELVGRTVTVRAVDATPLTILAELCPEEGSSPAHA